MTSVVLVVAMWFEVVVVGLVARSAVVSVSPVADVVVAVVAGSTRD